MRSIGELLPHLCVCVFMCVCLCLCCVCMCVDAWDGRVGGGGTPAGSVRSRERGGGPGGGGTAGADCVGPGFPLPGRFFFLLAVFPLITTFLAVKMD